MFRKLLKAVFLFFIFSVLLKSVVRVTSISRFGDDGMATRERKTVLGEQFPCILHCTLYYLSQIFENRLRKNGNCVSVFLFSWKLLQKSTFQVDLIIWYIFWCIYVYIKSKWMSNEVIHFTNFILFCQDTASFFNKYLIFKNLDCILILRKYFHFSKTLYSFKIANKKRNFESNFCKKK